MIQLSPERLFVFYICILKFHVQPHLWCIFYAEAKDPEDYPSHKTVLGRMMAALGLCQWDKAVCFQVNSACI